MTSTFKLICLSIIISFFRRNSKLNCRLFMRCFNFCRSYL